ncbi:MAG: hypothetical protein PHH01_02515 [Patescibacteria group bacterium]|nr:hypothetical protein [Patescibacteria group bacterium]MDD5567043.1 hypothetical protein [Patescibacteria group bacterium]
MKVKVHYRKTAARARLLNRSRYICPSCWTEAKNPGSCRCGDMLEKEKMRIVFKYI